MVFQHEFLNAINFDYELAQTHYAWLSYFVSSFAFMTAGFRTFFIIVSGIASGYVFFGQCMNQKISNVYLVLLLKLLGSLLCLPIWYFLHFAYNLSYGFSGRGVINISYPFWKSAYSMSHAAAFFGLVQPICILLNLVLYSVFVVPYKLHFQKILKYQHVMFIVATLCFFGVLL